MLHRRHHGCRGPSEECTSAPSTGAPRASGTSPATGRATDERPSRVRTAGRTRGSPAPLASRAVAELRRRAGTAPGSETGIDVFRVAASPAPVLREVRSRGGAATESVVPTDGSDAPLARCPASATTAGAGATGAVLGSGVVAAAGVGVVTGCRRRRREPGLRRPAEEESARAPEEDWGPGSEPGPEPASEAEADSRSAKEAALPDRRTSRQRRCGRRGARTGVACSGSPDGPDCATTSPSAT